MGLRDEGGEGSESEDMPMLIHVHIFGLMWIYRNFLYLTSD